MRRMIFGAMAAALAAMPVASAYAQGIPILDSSDVAIAIDAHGKTARSNFPGAEGPDKVIDGLVGSKYLNFGHSGSGVIVTPSAATPVESLQLTTANDAPARDPSSWELWGYNGALVSTSNSAGLNEPWTLIDAGTVTLPGNPTIGNDQRGVLGPLVDVNSGGIGYQHYKVVFPTLKDLSRANSMQVAEMQLFADNAGTTGILAPGNPVVGVNFGFESRYPNGERPALAIDQVATTKYLNFGEDRSGLIITNVEGAATVKRMRLTTAGDAPERDPGSFELWGTTNLVSSQDNTDGLNDENWTIITSGALTLPAARNDASTIVPINATVAYTSFKLVFPTVKDGAVANSMQIADVQFYVVPEPASLALALAGLAMACRIRRRS
jgi:MYXO-CTERM domain-containing protein